MSPRRRLLGRLLLLVSLLLPTAAQSQSLDTRHASLIDPLLYGSACTSTTLNAAISAALAGTQSRILMLTPVNRAREACVWTLTGDVVVPRTMTLWVPHGATVSISPAITLTVNGPLLAEDPLWWSGLGTLVAAFPQTPLAASSIESGCAPTVPSSSLTFAPFACQALLAQSSRLWGVAQTAASVTLASTLGIHWLAVCRDVVPTYAGWTRVAGTHYLHRAGPVSQPAAPAGCLVLTRAAVSGGIITGLEPVASAQKTRADTDLVYAEDFGAVFTQGGRDAVTADDCGAAITAALAALPLNGGTIQLGRGSCHVLTTIVLSKPVRLVGHGPQSPVGPQDSPTKLVKGFGLNGPVLRVTANAVHLADFDVDSQATAVAGNGIDILASYGSLTRVGVYQQQGSGVQVCHPTTVATCVGWLFTGLRAHYNGGSGLLFTGTQGSPTSPLNTAGHTVHGGSFASNVGDGITLRNTIQNTLIAPALELNGVFGIHLASWALENTIQVGKVLPNVGGFDVVISAAAQPSFGNYVLSMASEHTRVVDHTPLSTGSNTLMESRLGGGGLIQSGLGILAFDGTPHNVPIGYLQTNGVVGSGIAVVTEGEALTEANAKLTVKKAGVRLGGPGSQTIKANASTVNLVNFGASIPAHSTLYAPIAIAGLVGEACYASMASSVGANIGYCGCRMAAVNVAELCIVNPTPSAVALTTVTWRTVLFNY